MVYYKCCMPIDNVCITKSGTIRGVHESGWGVSSTQPIMMG